MQRFLLAVLTSLLAQQPVPPADFQVRRQSHRNRRRRHQQDRPAGTRPRAGGLRGHRGRQAGDDLDFRRRGSAGASRFAYFAARSLRDVDCLERSTRRRSRHPDGPRRLPRAVRRGFCGAHPGRRAPAGRAARTVGSGSGDGDQRPNVESSPVHRGQGAPARGDRQVLPAIGDDVERWNGAGGHRQGADDAGRAGHRLHRRDQGAMGDGGDEQRRQGSGAEPALAQDRPVRERGAFPPRSRTSCRARARNAAWASLREFIQTAQRSNVAVYPVDPCGLSSECSLLREQNLRTLAESTGGFAVSTRTSRKTR